MTVDELEETEKILSVKRIKFSGRPPKHTPFYRKLLRDYAISQVAEAERMVKVCTLMVIVPKVLECLVKVLMMLYYNSKILIQTLVCILCHSMVDGLLQTTT